MTWTATVTSGATGRARRRALLALVPLAALVLYTLVMASIIPAVPVAGWIWLVLIVVWVGLAALARHSRLV